MSNSKNFGLQCIEVSSSYLPLVAKTGIGDIEAKMQAVSDFAKYNLSRHSFGAFKNLVTKVYTRRGDSGTTIDSASVAAYGQVDVEAFNESHPELLSMGLRPVEIIISAGQDQQPTVFFALSKEEGELGMAAVLDALTTDYNTFASHLADAVADPGTMTW